MQRPILVTGANRSGTTWVGEVLCQSGELAYLHEPFNASLWPRLLDVKLGGHFTYVTQATGESMVDPVSRLLRYRFPVRSQLDEVHTARDGARFLRDWARSGMRRARHRRPLVKDPIALFASEWLAETFDMDVVVMIRHPAAFVSSIKRLGWDFSFGYLLEQPDLMDAHLAAFAPEIERFTRQRADPFDQGILLWRLFYSFVHDVRPRQPGWHFLRYEDLADRPLEGFEALYRRLDLRYDDDVAGRIWSYSDAGNVKEVAPSEKGTVKRDSQAAMWTWVDRLTPAEVQRVRRGVEDVSVHFYTDAEWERP